MKRQFDEVNWGDGRLYMLRTIKPQRGGIPQAGV